MRDTLGQISLFKELTDKQLACVPQGTELLLEPGEILFQQGTPPK
jgi:hypothetical protein